MARREKILRGFVRVVAIGEIGPRSVARGSSTHPRNTQKNSEARKKPTVAPPADDWQREIPARGGQILERRLPSSPRDAPKSPANRRNAAKKLLRLLAGLVN